ncbi:hypothetical protein [Nocardioides alcanivorans]|uniref:hypothetical protein n=1 Tax=Nocardioides alcanivorans TaxID=2897352 RepID=UPI001F38D59F|nr:hypothetical protein [Nocardioides alcanivorans]
MFAPFKPGAEPRLFDADGEIMLHASTDEGPLGEGELLTQVNGSGVPIVALRAVDARAATTHPVPMPEGERLRTVFADRSGLTAEGENSMWTSDDGGDTRMRNDADRGGHLTAFVPSAAPGTRVILLGGDGATLFPVQRVVRLFPDGTSAARDVDLDPRFYLGGMIREDGELVMALLGGN